MTNVDDIFARAAARNRAASVEAEKTRKPFVMTDWEALDAADEKAAQDRFESDGTTDVPED